MESTFFTVMNRKWYYGLLLIVNFLAIAFSMFACMYTVVTNEASVWLRISAGVCVLSMLGAFLYVLLFCQKYASFALRSFFCLYGISVLVNAFNPVVTSAYVAEKILGAAFCAATFVCLIILAFGKNLGKKRSYILCAILTVLNAAALIVGICLSPSLRDGTVRGTVFLYHLISQLTLSASTWMMTFAKYADKEARGSH